MTQKKDQELIDGLVEKYRPQGLKDIAFERTGPSAYSVKMEFSEMWSGVDWAAPDVKTKTVKCGCGECDCNRVIEVPVALEAENPLLRDSYANLPVLRFKQNDHSSTGRISTVRKGNKWFEHVKIGQLIWLAETGANPVCLVDSPKYVDNFVLAKILGTRLVHYYQLRNDPGLLTTNHDPACRTFEGLDKVMAACYGEMSDQDLVTIVYYEVSQ